MSKLNERSISLFMAMQSRINSDVLSSLVELIRLTREQGNNELISRVEKVLKHVEGQARLLAHLDTDAIIGFVDGTVPADLAAVLMHEATEESPSGEQKP